jgi:hypothetical protein
MLYSKYFMTAVCPQVFSSGGTCTLLPSYGARPCVEKMQFIFFVPPNEELEGTLHPQKFGCTPKNEGKRVHVPPDEKTSTLSSYNVHHDATHQYYLLTMYLTMQHINIIFLQCTCEVHCKKIMLVCCIVMYIVTR